MVDAKNWTRIGNSRRPGRSAAGQKLPDRGRHRLSGLPHLLRRGPASLHTGPGAGREPGQADRPAAGSAGEGRSGLIEIRSESIRLKQRPSARADYASVSQGLRPASRSVRQAPRIVSINLSRKSSMIAHLYIYGIIEKPSSLVEPVAIWYQRLASAWSCFTPRPLSYRWPIRFMASALPRLAAFRYQFMASA